MIIVDCKVNNLYCLNEVDSQNVIHTDVCCSFAMSEIENEKAKNKQIISVQSACILRSRTLL